MRHPNAPKTSCLLLTRTASGRASIVARCNEAARRGIRVGLSLAEAEALIDPRVRERHGGPWVEEISEERDLRALHALGMWLMGRFSPVVALDPPEGLLLDVAGTERLFGDENDLCRAILGGMHRFGLGARIAIADTVGTAWAVSRYGRTPRTLVDSGEESDALAPLPVDALRLSDPALGDALREVGVERIGQLMDLDRDRVAARFGADVGLRLDQALGRAFEPITPLRYETPPQVERTFEGPVKSMAAVTETAEALVKSLTDDLARARRGLLEGKLVLKPFDLPTRHVPIALARPSSDARHLWTMLAPKLEGIHLGFGIESVRFVAVRTGRLPTRQESAFGTATDSPKSSRVMDKHIGELIDVLVARLGMPAVVTPHAEATHLPERAFTLRPPAEPRRGPDPEAHADGRAPAREAPRPSKLFDPPEPATFDLQDEHGAPQRIRWRGIAYRVRRVRGPERIARPWWDDSPAWPDGSPHTVRDYFRLETACGRALWTFREPRHGRAFIHGEWT
ncbi:MAG: hypothetical protein AAGG01_08990 [Planctomycetota bacterium]